jgi:acyl carrier protein
MGLDGVELLMAVEDAFQIHIEDAEAEKTLTVGDLYNLVLSKLQGPDSKICVTSAAFYRIRRALVNVLNRERRSIGPSTLLETLLPRENRRERWGHFQQETTLEIPDLTLPSWILWIFLCCISIGIVLPILAGIHFHMGVNFDWAAAVLGFIVAMTFFAFVVVPISKPFAIGFPYRCETVGDLAKSVRDENFGKLSKELGGWNKDEVLTVLRRLIVKQLGVEESRLKLDARFIDDLGMD